MICAALHLHGNGWHYFATGADVLLSRDGLLLYATHAVLEAGPLSLSHATMVRPRLVAVGGSI